MTGIARVFAVIGLLVVGGAHAAVHGQQIRGRVQDAGDRSPVAAAEVELLAENGRVVARAATNENGHFVFDLPRSGVWRLQVTHVGYLKPEPVTIRVDYGEAVDVAVRIARSTIPLDPIVVTARSRDLRHERSYVAALARRATLPSVGNRRVLVRSDPEMRTAVAVNDVFQWLPPPGACKIFYIDGRPTNAQNSSLLLESSANNYAAIEYYRGWFDAPRDYRRLALGGNLDVDYMKCSIIGLWTR